MMSASGHALILTNGAAAGADGRHLHAAEGAGADLFRFSGPHAFADSEIWRRIEARLVALRTSGRFGISIVDAGCGSGIWLLRTALRARSLGFISVEGRGFDISADSIALARRSAAALVARENLLTFVVADIGEGLAIDEGVPADIVLCLNGVMNHLPSQRHREIARALSAAGRSLFVSVQTSPAPSQPGMETGRSSGGHKGDERHGVEAALRDSPDPDFAPNLLSAQDYLALFAPYGDILDRAWLDLHPAPLRTGPLDSPGALPDTGFDAVAWSDRRSAEDPSFLDRAAHILLHFRQRHQDRLP